MSSDVFHMGCRHLEDTSVVEGMSRAHWHLKFTLTHAQQYLYNILCVGFLRYKIPDNICTTCYVWDSSCSTRVQTKSYLGETNIFRILTRELSAYSRWILKSERQFFLKVYTKYHMAGGMIKDHLWATLWHFTGTNDSYALSHHPPHPPQDLMETVNTDSPFHGQVDLTVVVTSLTYLLIVCS